MQKGLFFLFVIFQVNVVTSQKTGNYCVYFQGFSYEDGDTIYHQTID